eukprot:jgi/Ulvmu1/9334/UM050_0084.1
MPDGGRPGVMTVPDASPRSGTVNGFSEPEPSLPPSLPPQLEIAAANFSHTPTAEPDFASLLSPVLATSQKASRQPSLASLGVSMPKPDTYISASERHGSLALSQVSLGSYERPPLPDAAPPMSPAALLGSDADYPDRTESPRLPASASRPGLAGLAQQFASAAGSPPSYGPALLRQAPPAVSRDTYTRLLQALLLRWAPTPPAELQRRLQLCQCVQALLQVPEAMHCEATAAALAANAHILQHLRSRLLALQTALQHLESTPGSIAAATQRFQPLLLGPEQFEGADAEGRAAAAYAEWLRGEIECTQRSITLQRERPDCQAVVRVEGLAAKGLRAGVRRRGQIARFACCAAPAAAVELDALFFKIWVAGSRESADDKQGIYTSEADGSGEAGKGRAAWEDPLQEFTATSGGAMLCFELRNLRDRSAAGRSLLGKPGSRAIFDSIGSVAVRLADLEEAGPGKHRCKVALLSCNSSSTGTAPLSAHRPSISLDTVPSPTPDPPVSPRPGASSRKGPKRRPIGTLEFVFEALVERRAGDGGADGGEGVAVVAADATVVKHVEGGEEGEDGLDSGRVPAHTVTGLPSLDDGAQMSGFPRPDPLAMTPRIKSAQGALPRSSASRASAPASPPSSRRSGADSRHVFKRSRRSMRESFRRRATPAPLRHSGLLTPDAASAALTEVFQHLLEATKTQNNSATADGLESLLEGRVQEVAGLLPPGAQTDAVLELCKRAQPHTLPPWALTLLTLLAAALHVRPAQLLLLLAAAASSCPPLSATDPTFPARLAAFTLPVSPLAAAMRAGTLTTGEAAALNRTAAPLLAEAAWALDRLHGALLAQHAQHGAGVLRTLLAAVALSVRHEVEVAGVATEVAPHLREAVERRMLPHMDLSSVGTRFDAVPVLVDALGTILHDLPLEAGVAPDLPRELQLLEVSASVRYSMVTACLERLWGTVEAPPRDTEDGELLYDGLLQQLEDRLLRVHRLMLELGVATLPPAAAAGPRASAGAPPPAFGLVTYVPCAGIPLVSVPLLLAPAMLAWISVVGVKLEGIAASYVAADAGALSPRPWAPLSRLRGFLCSSSLVDTFHAVINSVDAVATRAVAAQPRVVAVPAAEAVAAAAGGAARWYASAVEAAALADLRPAAEAAAAAGTLPPAGRALLSAHLNAVPAEDGNAVATPRLPPANGDDGVAWPPIIRRELAVKLNNLLEASVRLGGVEGQVAAHLARAEDALLGKPMGPTPAPVAISAVFTGRARSHGVSGRSMQVSVQSLDETADDLSFMSDSFDGVRDKVSPFPDAAEQLPASVQHVFVEAADNVRRSRLTVLTAIKHAFAGMFTEHVTAALARQPRPSKAAPPAPGQVNPDDESLQAAAEHTAAAGDGKYKAVLKSVAASVAWGRSKPAGSDVGGGHEARAAQVVEADAELDAAALNDLLEIINREFQVMKEMLLPALFADVQTVLWQAAIEATEALLLASAPGQAPLSFAQAYALRAAHLVLRDHFHAAGAGLPLRRLDDASQRAMSLFQLFMGPTAALTALADDGAWPGAGEGGAGGQRRAAGPVVAQVDVFRLLRQRSGDQEARSTLQELARRAVMKPMQVLFGLPGSEDVVQRVDCRLVDHSVAGTLFLATSHLCFSSLAPLAAAAASVAPGSGFSLKRSSLFAAEGVAQPNVTLVARLAKVRSMAPGFARRSRSLVFTLDDNSQVEVAHFRSAETRGAFEEAVRLHVLGCNSALDRQLRGVATTGTTPSALRLPPGEAVLRSYACALYALVRNRRGALHVCHSLLLFAGRDDTYRTVVRFEHVISVELAKGHWRGGLYVVLATSHPPHKLEFCEMPEVQAEELVAEILNRIGQV